MIKSTMTPIIMYHALSDDVVSDKYTLTAEKFRQHLSIIKDAGKSGISLASQYNNYTDNNVIITFDDGHVSNLQIAAPILKEFGFTATFFITTNRVNNGKEWLRWEDISEMMKLGMDIQAHGHTHAFLDIDSRKVLLHELSKPKILFKDKLYLDIQHFSLPGGRYCHETMSLAKELAYMTISTSTPGLNNFDNKSDFQILRRFVVHQGIDDSEFKKIIKGNYYYCKLAIGKYKLKKIGKKVLGNNLYQKLWELVMR